MNQIQHFTHGGSCPFNSHSPTLLYPSSGAVTIPMTNDYLFRAFLQQNNKALKGLICALLHLDPRKIYSVEITNPIVLGDSTNDKTFILDIRVQLNGSAIINLEMQVINQFNWVDRSLSYLCRNFDHSRTGAEYEDIHPVVQIGILNFPLFEDRPEFYATYQLLNVKNYALYSDKLRLSVLDLTHINMATEEDKLYQLDYWASLFKATTWEEITMLAEKNEYIAETAATVYRLTQDERVRMECEAREDLYRTQLGIQRRLERLGVLEATNEALESRSAELEVQNSELEAKSMELEAKNAALEAEMKKLLAWAKKNGYES